MEINFIGIAGAKAAHLNMLQWFKLKIFAKVNELNRPRLVGIDRTAGGRCYGSAWYLRMSPGWADGFRRRKANGAGFAGFCLGGFMFGNFYAFGELAIGWIEW